MQNQQKKWRARINKQAHNESCMANDVKDLVWQVFFFIGICHSVLRYDPTLWAAVKRNKILCRNIKGNLKPRHKLDSKHRNCVENFIGRLRMVNFFFFFLQVNSSQLADPLWTDPGITSGISVRELISTEKKKKRWRGTNGRTFSRNPRKRGKSHRMTAESLTLQKFG